MEKRLSIHLLYFIVKSGCEPLQKFNIEISIYALNDVTHICFLFYYLLLKLSNNKRNPINRVTISESLWLIVCLEVGLIIKVWQWKIRIYFFFCSSLMSFSAVLLHIFLVFVMFRKFRFIFCFLVSFVEFSHNQIQRIIH